MCPDVGSSRHQQWFYFEVSNMRSDLTYTFSIINNEKLSCEYQTGRSQRRDAFDSPVKGVRCAEVIEIGFSGRCHC